MLDKLSDFLFGDPGDKITKWGITLCGLIIAADILSKII